MLVPVNNLSQHLSKKLSTIYLVTGDEILLVNDCREAIKSQAVKDGFTEHNLFQIDNSQQISALEYELNSYSLFNSKKIIELRAEKAKLSTDLKQIITQYCANPRPEYILLLTLPKLAAADTKQAWYKAIDELGTIVTIWPIAHQELAAWIKQRMHALGINSDAAGYQLIADCVEGNLLAADQEIKKLALLYPAGYIAPPAIQQALANNTRYNAFELADAALAQQTKPCLKILTSLQKTGIEPAIILWALCQDLRKLIILQQLQPHNHQQFIAICQKHAIWSTRQKLFKHALTQLNLEQTYELLQYAKHIDAIIKGIKPGNVWQALQRWCASYTTPNLIKELLVCKL